MESLNLTAMRIAIPNRRSCLLLLAAGCAHSARPTEGPVERTRWVMGTRLRIVVWDKQSAAAERTIARAFEVAEALDGLLSNFKPESELSRFNAAAGQWMEVSPEFLRFLRASLDLAQRTDGLFDPTVGSLVRGEPGAATRVGYRMLSVDDLGARARLELPGMALDPGAIGKGVAVDAIVAVLRESEVRRAFVDFGESSFYALGEPATRIALRNARGEPQGPVVMLHNTGLSTSMTTTFPEGRHHLLDPRSGQRVEKMRIAAVISRSGTVGDVLATALAVGGQDSLTVVERFPDVWVWLDENGQPPLTRGQVVP